MFFDGTLNELIKIGKKYYILFHRRWNGEYYFDCVRADKYGVQFKNSEYFDIRPIYSEMDEDDCCALLGYEIL
jgi:hypothetical protein